MMNLTRADRNNNPTNIKLPKGGLEVAKQRYGDPGLSVDPAPATDGGQFLKFSTPEYGHKATGTLLTSPGYANLTVDKALKAWSGGGYGGDVAPDLKNKTISSLSPEELATVTQGMAKREGYTGASEKSNPSLLTSILGAVTGAKTAYAEGNQDSPQSPQLSHDQLTANIDAMESQGASRDEVQGYLDSLSPGGNSQNQSTGYSDKIDLSGVGGTDAPNGPNPTEAPPSELGVFDNFGKGNYGKAALGLLGNITGTKDLGIGLGRAINNATGQPDELLKQSQETSDLNAKLAQKLKDPNISDVEKSKIKNILNTSTDYAGKAYNDVSTAGLSNTDVLMSAGQTALTTLTAPKLIAGLLQKGGTAMGSGSLKGAIDDTLGKGMGEEFAKSSIGDQANMLKQVAENASEEHMPLINAARQELATALRLADGVGTYSELNPGTAKILGMSGKLLKWVLGASLVGAVGGSAYATSQGLYKQITGQ